MDWTRKLNSNKNNRFPGLGCAMALLEYVSRRCVLHLHNTARPASPFAASAACWRSGTMWAIGGVEDGVYNHDVYSSTAGIERQQTWQHVAQACSHNTCTRSHLPLPLPRTQPTRGTSRIPSPSAQATLLPSHHQLPPTFVNAPTIPCLPSTTRSTCTYGPGQCCCCCALADLGMLCHACAYCHAGLGAGTSLRRIMTSMSAKLGWTGPSSAMHPGLPGQSLGQPCGRAACGLLEGQAFRHRRCQVQHWSCRV